MLRNCPYERNDAILSSRFNLLYGEAVSLTNDQFHQWCIDLRREVVRLWDEEGIPPVSGKDSDAIIADFNRLRNRNLEDVLTVDELTLEEDCILNNTTLGSTCNQFFPTMLKTKDITSSDKDGVSVYDTFATDEYLDVFVKKASNCILDDGMYLFSHKVEKNKDHAVSATTGKNWLTDFPNRTPKFHFFDYWIQKHDGKRYRGRSYLTVSRSDLQSLIEEGIVNAHNITRIDLTNDPKSTRYRIRLYDATVRLFPKSFNIFKSMILISATNFPPLTARFIYEYFTRHIADQPKITVYDPSAGWGGRILGAMATHNNRRMHYVGTDPNPVHWIDELEMTKYEYLASYFNSNVRGRQKNTHEVFSVGSEVIHKERKFQKYKGKLDFVFTSPPYFAAEGYSEDENQSYKKFPTYGEWRDGFLYQTLKTASEYLAHDRYLCWNIADIMMGNSVVPLERDTIDIMAKLGMDYRGKLKMVLGVMKGKQSSGNMPVTRNFCRIGNQYRKYEPILIFYKN